MNKRKAFVLSFFVLGSLLILAFRQKDHGLYRTNWLIVQVDTGGSGYFSVNPANRRLFRIERDWFGEKFYLVNGSSTCPHLNDITDKDWSDCWLRIASDFREKEHNHYSVTMMGNRDNLYGTTMLHKLEYGYFLRNFLVQSYGSAIVRNDSLFFDVTNTDLGKRVPFKIICIRDSIQ